MRDDDDCSLRGKTNSASCGVCARVCRCVWMLFRARDFPAVVVCPIVNPREAKGQSRERERQRGGGGGKSTDRLTTAIIVIMGRSPPGHRFVVRCSFSVKR